MSSDTPQGDPLLMSNMIVDDKCKNCGCGDKSETVSCLFCKQDFHFYDCFENSNDDIAPSSCGKSFYKAINKIGKYSHRPGNFRFVCDPCLTKFENDQTCTSNDRVQMLDNRVSNLAGDVTSIKEMLKDMYSTRNVEVNSTPSVSIPATETSNTSEVNSNVVHNPWEDKVGVKSLLVVNKEYKLQTKNLENSITSNGLQVSGQYVNKKGDQVFVLPSQDARAKLKNELTSTGVPDQHITEPKQRYPAISVVGIPNCYDKDAKDCLTEALLNQNPNIASLVRAENAMFEILAIKTVRNNANVNQAIIRLSDHIRHAIKNMGDRLFCGMSSCKVYDQLYIKRCNRCQDFGHYAKECSGSVCCGICASSEHESLACQHSINAQEDGLLCCINCKKAGLNDVMKTHQANSIKCPTYLAKQEKLKKSISYYNPSKN